MKIEFADNLEADNRFKRAKILDGNIADNQPLLRFGNPVPAEITGATTVREACNQLEKYLIPINSKTVLKLETVKRKMELVKSVNSIATRPEEKAFYLGISTTALSKWMLEIQDLPRLEQSIKNISHNFKKNT